jgi:hypothetical protein
MLTLSREHGTQANRGFSLFLVNPFARRPGFGPLRLDDFARPCVDSDWNLAELGE